MNTLTGKMAALFCVLALALPGFAGAAPPSPGAAPPTPQSAPPNPGAELRAGLGRELGEYAILEAAVMQKVYEGKTDAADLEAAVSANAATLNETVQSVYGPDVRKTFQPVWSGLAGSFRDYAEAAAEQSAAGRQSALRRLNGFGQSFAEFLAKADPRLDADSLGGTLQAAVDTLIGAFDSYTGKNETRAFAGLREAYARMASFGNDWAGAIIGSRPDTYGELDGRDAASGLRIAFGQDFGEHALLAALAMQKAFDGAPDSLNAAASLSSNGDELTELLSSVYGAESGARFGEFWAGYLGFLTDFAKATREGSDDARQAARNGLDNARSNLAHWLAGVNPNLPADRVSSMLQKHTALTLGAFENYVYRNTDQGYLDLRDAYAQMCGFGDVLADAVVTQFPEKYVPSLNTVWMQIGSNVLRINNRVTIMDTTPFRHGDYTFVPVRYLSEGLGAIVLWDGAKQEVTVRSGKDTAVFYIGKDEMDFNGQRRAVGNTVFINGDGRTQVPLRLIAELLGWTVTWNNSDRSIVLTRATAP
jgi:hypothetical protein